MSGGRRFRPTERVAAREVDDELVLLDLEDGAFFRSGGVGPRVWEQLAGGASVAEAAEMVAERFDVEPEQIREDIERFAASLVERGFLAEEAE